MPWADLVLWLHLAYVAFVASGYFLIPLGAWLGWGWVRNRWYRRLHVAGIGIVALEALVGVVCPLTWLENALRGQQDGLTFMGRLAEALLYSSYPLWVYTVLYVAALTLALYLYRRIPPRARDQGNSPPL